MLRKFTALLFLFSIGLILTGCNLGNTKDENVVNIYSSRHYDTDQMLFEKFTAETGITVNVVKGDASELITRLENEGEDTLADLIYTADAGRLHIAKEKGLLQPVMTDVLSENIPSNYRDLDNNWFGLTMRARVLVYSLDRINPDQLSTYEALTEEAWKGRIVTRSSSNVYNQSLMASFIEVMGEAEAKNWAEGLVNNFARDPKGNDRDQAKEILAGNADVAIMNTYYIGRMLHSSDPYEVEVANAVGVFFPNQETTGTHVNISGAGVTKYANNVENAIKLIEFLSSEAAQYDFSSENFEYPVNPNVQPHELLQSWGTFVTQDINLSQLGINSVRASQIMDEIGWK